MWTEYNILGIHFCCMYYCFVSSVLCQYTIYPFPLLMLMDICIVLSFRLLQIKPPPRQHCYRSLCVDIGSHFSWINTQEWYC